jgi:DNA-binding PadR family transcriptional regulator
MHKERMEKMVRDADRYGAGFGYGTDRFTGDGGRGRGRGRSRGGRGQGDGFGRHGGPGGFGPGFGPGFGGPMFGRGPKVGRGDVRAAILALLAEDPMHGYQIINELKERTSGVWRPSPGSVYPTLQALEDEGLIIADKDSGRRVFTLTDDGRAAAAELGDGPAPWEEVTRGTDTSMVDLRNLTFQVGAAIMQVAQAGTPAQVSTVQEILVQTRRRIYQVLADDGSETGGDATAGSPATGGPDGPGTTDAG